MNSQVRAREEQQLEHRRRPQDTRFLQQQLKTWSPTFNTNIASFLMRVAGGIFILCGLYFMYTAFMLSEIVIDYTDCQSTLRTGVPCSEIIGNISNVNTPDCICNINFGVDDRFQGRKVYVYYALTKAYQNYRRLMKSRDDRQLSGLDVNETVSPNCAPFARSKHKKIIWPCGALANAMFQDTFTIKKKRCGRKIFMSYENVVWITDKLKHKNPPNWNTPEFRKLVIPPFNWKRSPWDFDPENPQNNGVENVDFIVWMRPEPLSNFRKLYRHIDKGLEPGEYTIEIKYSYPVKAFHGTKSIVLGTTSELIGGKSYGIGVAFIFGGVLYYLLGLGFRSNR